MKKQKLIKKLNKIGVKISPIWLVVVSFILMGGVVAAGEVKSNQIESNLISQEQKLYEEIIILREEISQKNDVANSNQSEPESEKPKEDKVPEDETVVQQQTNIEQTTVGIEQNQEVVKQEVQTPPTSAPTPSSHQVLESGSSLSFINGVRSNAGKAALAANGTMNAWAIAWTKNLADRCELDHQNLGSFLGQNIGPVTTSSVAENVGYHTTVTNVLNGLKNSPGHYGNMTGDYSYVGIGVVKSGSGWCKDYIFTTQIFAS